MTGRLSMPLVLGWVQGLLAWGSPSSHSKAPKQAHWGPSIWNTAGRALPREGKLAEKSSQESFFQAKNIHLLMCLKRQEESLRLERNLRKGNDFKQYS